MQWNTQCQSWLETLFTPKESYEVIALLQQDTEVYILQQSAEEQQLLVTILNATDHLQTSGQYKVKFINKIVKAVNCKE